MWIMSVAWVALALSAPIMLNLGFKRPAQLVYGLQRFGCSQNPAHSFLVCDHPMGLCIRHTLMYLGFGLSAAWNLGAARSFPRPSYPALIAVIGCFPFVLDAGLEFLGVWGSSNPLRGGTGLMAGLGVGTYVMLSQRHRDFRAPRRGEKYFEEAMR
jgi:uncharacterized membrane protein